MIHILMGFCNVEAYLERAIQSLQLQQFKEWTCHLLDDASTDGSIEIAHEVSNSDSRFVYHRNETKKYLVHNYFETIKGLNDDDICITVDGDDYLPDSGVLTRIDSVYQQDILVTWGSALCATKEGSFVVEQHAISDVSHLRKQQWVPFHLRTWKVSLWRQIKERDLKDEKGNWWTVAGDLAFMYPMIEMAGVKYSKFLSEINYVYNYDNPHSNHRVRRGYQLGNDKAIRNKPSYCFSKMCL